MTDTVQGRMERTKTNVIHYMDQIIELERDEIKNNYLSKKRTMLRYLREELRCFEKLAIESQLKTVEKMLNKVKLSVEDVTEFISPQNIVVQRNMLIYKDWHVGQVTEDAAGKCSVEVYENILADEYDYDY